MGLYLSLERTAVIECLSRFVNLITVIEFPCMKKRFESYSSLGIHVSGLPFMLLLSVLCSLVGLAEDASREKVFNRFESEIYPLMTRLGEDSCVSCHDPDTSSNLVFIGNARDDFQLLLDQKYFSNHGPDSILARLVTENGKKRMPKGKSLEPWAPQEIELFRSFLNELHRIGLSASHDDESFPLALLNPYEGNLLEQSDHPFITYSQLKGKIQTLFEDDWVRGGKDLFAENVAFFNGADFVTRFNESSQASSSFLTGLDMVARDVGARAYRNRTGPFSRHPFNLMNPEDKDTPPDGYQRAIEGLYQSILFRAPKPDELNAAYRLIRHIYGAKEAIHQRDYELGFKLTVQDPSTGLQSEEHVRVAVSADSLGLHQEWVDQTSGEPLVKGEDHLHFMTLNRPLKFRADHSGQRILVHRLESGESVSLAAVQIQSIDGEQAEVLGVTHPSVMRDGAWKLTTRHGFTSFEHEKVAVGLGVIEVPIEVAEDGEFEVSLIWRSSEALSNQVLVEVFTESPSALAMPPLPEIPEKGQAHFFYDSSEDARPYAALPAQYRFAEKDFVEVNNAGTDQRVTVGALSLVPVSGGESWLIDSRDADGNEGWSTFKSGQFSAYNQKGTPLQDDNAHKGERFLKFRPSSKTATWDEGSYYQVRIHYPGKRDHETSVPVIVHAAQSSPIIHLAHPFRAKTGSSWMMDASGSYTVQHSALQFHWEQTEGVPVHFEQVGSVLKVNVFPESVEEAGWTALVRALMRHPDFIFTNPPSVKHAVNAEERRTLQLVRIALDLLGRPPSEPERQLVRQGVEIPDIVGTYLDSQEFRNYYFHRIRLYLESQGTSSQDEPARLWSYVAYNDLPFSEILTADYTVDEQFKKESRPSYHGRTGVLTTRGFIEGKPGLPHYNYAAQVSMLFLGYVFELPPELAESRDGITALGTTDPNSACYSCHKILTPLALQRSFWADDGQYRTRDKDGSPIRADDHGWVDEYPFKGVGMEAFATQAVKKERFIRTIINTHFNFFFGRSMRHLSDERSFYKYLWDNVHENQFKIRSLIQAIVCSPQYLGHSDRKQVSLPMHNGGKVLLEKP